MVPIVCGRREGSSPEARGTLFVSDKETQSSFLLVSVFVTGSPPPTQKTIIFNDIPTPEGTLRRRLLTTPGPTTPLHPLVDPRRIKSDVKRRTTGVIVEPNVGTFIRFTVLPKTTFV